MTVIAVCAECQAAASVDTSGEADPGSTAAVTVPRVQWHPAPHQGVRVGACYSCYHHHHHYQG